MNTNFHEWIPLKRSAACPQGFVFTEPHPEPGFPGFVGGGGLEEM